MSPVYPNDQRIGRRTPEAISDVEFRYLASLKLTHHEQCHPNGSIKSHGPKRCAVKRGTFTFFPAIEDMNNSPSTAWPYNDYKAFEARQKKKVLTSVWKFSDTSTGASIGASGAVSFSPVHKINKGAILNDTNKQSCMRDLAPAALDVNLDLEYAGLRQFPRRSFVPYKTKATTHKLESNPQEAIEGTIDSIAIASKYTHIFSNIHPFVDGKDR
ncbi:hypothetical protein N7449_011954 [Penicillium cf. viridicatum]|uniref:Fido domain-containing protein n=1 Tax=Penicillium cf. viridicatum TaxID=2972119 RepID=A0A9W9LZ11_9EURO|nr:hypothetical protein N7449_011954 [Penicillium cf. viridicatum]